MASNRPGWRAVLDAPATAFVVQAPSGGQAPVSAGTTLDEAVPPGANYWQAVVTGKPFDQAGLRSAAPEPR